MLEALQGVDKDADAKYGPLYDQSLTREYPYVRRLRETVFRSFTDLMEVFPAPAPFEVNPEVVDASIETTGPVSELVQTGSTPPAIDASLEKTFGQENTAAS